MTQEEKAKAYDEALERARALRQEAIDKEYAIDYVKDYEAIFPELRESEDERIRKEIIHYILHKADGVSEEQGHSWIAYLEKQKENPDRVNLIGKAKSEKQVVLLAESNGDENIYWDTKSEEDAVSLLEKGLKFFEKQKEQKPTHFELKAGKWYICHRAFCCRADHLTVKEGERFMCEKDGVVKGFVIKEPEKYFKECSAPAPMEDEQKQEWSEEDELMMKAVIGILGEDDHPKLCSFLKSLRPSWKPSKEQMKAFTDFIIGNEYDAHTLAHLWAELKELSERLIS